MTNYSGLRVFSATKAVERERLGQKVTQWLQENPELTVVETVVKQSSYQQFHCLSILIFYR